MAGSCLTRFACLLVHLCIRIPNLIISKSNQRSHHLWNVNMKFMFLEADVIVRQISSIVVVEGEPSFVECKPDVNVS